MRTGRATLSRRADSRGNNLVCQLVGNAAGTTQKLRVFENGGNGLISEVDHAVVANMTSEVEVIETAPGSYSCNATNVSATTLGDSTFTGPRIGVRVRSANAHVHWVMVIASP